MGALGTGALTLADWGKRQDPNGSIAKLIVELLNQENGMLLDVPWVEGNLATGTRTTLRTALPSVSWRTLNAGVSPSKSTTVQVDEQCAILEAWSEVDVDLAKLNGDVGAFLLSEARPFLEAMKQEMASTLLYGNGALAAEEFTGLITRYNAKSGATNGDNVLLFGNSAALTSMLLVSWGQETVHGVVPKGSTAGLTQEDLGIETVEAVAGIGGSRMRAFRSRYQWKAGLAVRDWRSVVRIANIGTGSTTNDLFGSSPYDLLAMMGDAEEIIGSGGTKVWYCNRTVKRALRRLAYAAVKAGGGLTWDNYAGQRVLMHGEIPIRTVDAFTNAETQIS